MRAVGLGFVLWMLLAVLPRKPEAAAGETPLFFSQLHYGAGAAAALPAADAIALLERAGVRRVLVSATREEDLHALLVAGSHVVAPELTPYRRRSELMSWFHDASGPGRLAERAARLPYVALGALHLYGAQVDLPVVRATLAIARRRNLLLHVQADVDAIDRIYRLWPEARVLWAHAGFAPIDEVRAALDRHRRLWCDLGRRSDVVEGGRVTDEWLAVFEAHADRFVLGFENAPIDQWHQIEPQSVWARAWLGSLPDDIAQRLAWKNGVNLLDALAPLRDSARR